MSPGLTDDLMAMRIAREFRSGMVVNLGIGLPTRAALFVPPEVDVYFVSETGVLGWGRVIESRDDPELDPELINPSTEPVTVVPGASFFDCAMAFTIIRGGHVDLSVLGAFQVSEKGDLANWRTTRRSLGGIGGAMDVAVGAAGNPLIVAMRHTTRTGSPRIVRECSYPVTAWGAVTTVITDLAVIDIRQEDLVLRELAPGVLPEEVQTLTEPELKVVETPMEMVF